VHYYYNNIIRPPRKSLALIDGVAQGALLL
jgi:hypothetical protein